MSSFRVAIMTDAGVKLMADSIIEGYKIEFVKMVIGSGEYEEEEKTADALRIRTELKQKRQEVGFSSRLISDKNEVLLKTLITNKELDVGYRMREIGIIAKRAEEDEEILYSIAIAEEADYLPPKDNPVEIIQEYYTKVSNVENIIINVEMEAYALAEDMQKILYPEYDEAKELVELESGRNIFEEFGKLKKAVSDLIGHIRDKVIHITSEERKLWNTVSDKVDKVKGKGLSANDYTTEEKNKLGGIEERANNYVHPNTHPANIIVQDSAHRFVTDSEKNTWNETLDNAKNYSDSAYQQATGYIDQKIADLIGGAPETLDTLKEVADAIQANKDVSTALDAAIGKKANQTELDTHTGNNTIHITSTERTNWNDANTKKHTHSNKGVLDKITQSLLDSWDAAYTHISDAVKHITAEERTKWNAAKIHADSAHARTDATKTEKSNTNGNIKINGTETNVYAHPNTAGNKHIPSGGSSGQILRWSADGTAAWGNDNNTTYSNMSAATASTAGKAGLVPAPAAGKQASFLRGDGTWAVPTNTTYSAATQSANGLMSSTDKKKLDGITEGADKTVVDSALSSTSTNPVQNKAIKIALDGKAASSHTHNYAGSSSAGGSANSAVKLDSSAGSATQPVYFKDGKPAACSYTLGASVPSGAKFTDTVYTLPTASSTLGGVKTTSTVTSSTGYTACPIISGVPYYKDTNTTYSAATQSVNGLMSAADKKKLDGIAEGANKTVVDSALSSTSTNPVQNKVIKSALDGKAASSHTHSNYFDSNTSRTKNTVLAAPSAEDGAASFRALTIADLPTASAATNRNRVPVITANGVMEIGEYIDFHIADDANVDCDFRIRGTSTSIYFTQKNKAYGTLYAASYTIASSKRYKNNIVNMSESDAEKLLDINVKRFDYTIDDRKDIAGCIAEEVEKIFPDVCSYQDENKTTVDGIDYSKFVPYLIKLAQKQQKQIEEMQKEICSLKRYHNS